MVIELTAMSVASHPRRVRKAVKRFRRELDRSPHQVAINSLHLDDRVFAAAGRYFDVDPGLVAFTHSTTVGLSQVYGGIRIAPGDEILTSTSEHFTTIDALRLRQRRDTTPFRQVELFRNSRTVTTAEILRNLAAALRQTTRVLALTWVYSSNGVKLPIRAIAGLVAVENTRRAAGADRLLFVVDGVHGFGVENVTFGDLDCDLFVAGCHKWVFGPRGTAIICGKLDAWAQMMPLLASFFPDDPKQPALQFIPGGNLAYEHFWALADAFAFLESIGKANIEGRVHQLCGILKQRLAEIDGVTIVTPQSDDFSAGIVTVDVDGLDADAAVARLIARPHRISASASGRDVIAGRTHLRFSPAIFNMEEDIERAIAAVAAIAASAKQ
jgi:selenocysteine lyase/cysteine desulfurase